MESILRTKKLYRMEAMRNTTFREVHKNAWLKLNKDRLWIVFCVHDDTVPFLEAYTDNKIAAAHKPHWFISLVNTLHITPTIYPEGDYEFVIALQKDIIKLSAPSWQLMIDWVETLRRKLHEMRILAPKENVYSKLPETKNVCLLPTRDPTSPLPPPPMQPAALMPGVEPPQNNSALNDASSSTSVDVPSSSEPVNSVCPPHYEQLFLQFSSNEAPVIKRAQRSMSNCDRQENSQQTTGEPTQHRRRSNSDESAASGRRLTLRAQQVLQLRREIMHPAGLRLRLRTRDSVNSIALVDGVNGVWIAGWKQKEHPILYNALHIGDQLISVENVPIQKASDALRILRLALPSLYIDLVVKRVPFGQVFAIRRDCDGQPLGLIQEDGTAVIKEVVPDGLAARHGLMPKAQSIDGLSLTNWVLTEINGRPLNLFYKDNEVRDRLNSVGRDISILVQPLDFIKHIKKQLKSIRNYKDYLLQ